MSFYKLEPESFQILFWGFSHVIGTCSQPANATWKHEEVNFPRNNFRSVREGDGGERLQLSSAMCIFLGSLLYTRQRFQLNQTLYAYRYDLKETHSHLGFSYLSGSFSLLHTSASRSHLLSRLPPSNPCLRLCF